MVSHISSSSAKLNSSKDFASSTHFSTSSKDFFATLLTFAADASVSSTALYALSRIPFAKPSPIYLPIAIKALDGECIPNASFAAANELVAKLTAAAIAEELPELIPDASPNAML